MTLKEALLEELQKLRLNRERPPIKQAKTKSGGHGKQSTQEKLMEEAKKLLDQLEDE